MHKRLAIAAIAICLAAGVLFLGITSRAVVEGHAYSIPFGETTIGSVKQPDGSSWKQPGSFSADGIQVPNQA
jgi:hypothetical protein